MGFEFSKIYVLESLPPHEEQTGEYLVNDLFPYCNLHLEGVQLKFELLKIENKIELLSAFCKIEEESETELPLIHFEIHGREEQDGMQLRNRDVVLWGEVIDRLQRINKKAYCNLFLVMAVCSGAHIFKSNEILRSPLPFYGVVGPNSPEYPIVLQCKYSWFYQELLVNMNGDAAVKKLNEENVSSSMSFITCDFILFQAFVNEMHDQTQQARIESLVLQRAKIIEEEEEGPIDLDVIREEVKRAISSRAATEKVFEKMKNKYLMADHEFNKGRFRFTLDDLSNRMRPDSSIGV